jgi:hypothetical protein
MLCFICGGGSENGPGDRFPDDALMENRSGLIVQGDLTQADGRAERKAALYMIHRHSPGSTRRLTLGADKGFDAAEFVADLRRACVTPHVAQKSRYSAIDGRTTRHEGYALSIRHRKRIDLRRETIHWGLLKKLDISDSLCLLVDEGLRCWVGRNEVSWSFSSPVRCGI